MTRTDRTALKQRESYANPTLDCDMVMKGGITSGVVYPLAICELATRYRFHSLGGSSAGAIAAAACAAAEFGRHSSKGGFQHLATMPDYLGGDGRLMRLFQPGPSTRPLFGLLLFGLKNREAGTVPWFVEIVKQVWSAAGGKWWLVKTTLSLAAAVAGYVWLVHRTGNPFLSFAFLAALGIVLAYLTSRAAGSLFRSVLGILRDNSFGLCTGLHVEPGGPQAGENVFDRRPPGPAYALADWLTDELDTLAGGLDNGEPLCFGHLLSRSKTCPETPGQYDPLKQIKLEMFTTSLTHGRPFRMPLRPGVHFNTDGFFFDPATMRKFFPERVVAWMESHPPRRSSLPDQDQAEYELLCRVVKAKHGLCPLPSAECLPVVVATRMSLSFPALISAVPLLGIDWTEDANKEMRREWREFRGTHGKITGPLLAEGLQCYGAPRLKPVWLSDGGICSNFPIHFFDGPIPRWPTFGINLRTPTGRIDDNNQEENVFLAPDSSEGRDLTWTRIEDVFGFGKSIIETMYTWSDNSQMRVHGYWDRIAHILLDEQTEGGLNLAMPDDLIRKLGERGHIAGSRLANRFDPAAQKERPHWDSHRWSRFRTIMALLEDTISRIDGAFHHPPQANSRTYEALVFRLDRDEPDTGHWWERNAQRDLAQDATRTLLDAIARWRKAHPDQVLNEGAPRPRPHLRIAPPI